VRIHHRVGIVTVEVQSLLAGELVAKLTIRGIELRRNVDRSL
jgi:hypothetical protein